MTDQSLRLMLSACLSESSLPQEVEDHLAESATCDDECTELRLTVLALRQLPTTALPRSFALDDLTLHRYRRRQHSSGVTWILRSVVASAAVLFLVVGAGDLRHSLEGPTVSPSIVSFQAQPMTAAAVAADVKPMPATNAAQINTTLYRGLEVALAGIVATTGGALWWTSRRNRA